MARRKEVYWKEEPSLPRLPLWSFISFWLHRFFPGLSCISQAVKLIMEYWNILFSPVLDWLRLQNFILDVFKASQPEPQQGGPCWGCTSDATLKFHLSMTSQIFPRFKSYLSGCKTDYGILKYAIQSDLRMSEAPEFHFWCIQREPGLEAHSVLFSSPFLHDLNNFLWTRLLLAESAFNNCWFHNWGDSSLEECI